MIKLRYFWCNYFLNNFPLLICLLRLVYWWQVSRYIATSSSDRRLAECRYTHFLMTNVLQQQFLYCLTWNSNQLLNLNIISFLFLQTFLLINSISLLLMIESSASIHWQTGLTNLFPSFLLFLVLFWMLWMLVTVYKPCCVPHASRTTTSGTIFTERLFSVSKEWVRSWSHAFLITYDKTLTKKLLAVRPEKVTRRKKRSKK